MSIYIDTNYKGEIIINNKIEIDTITLSAPIRFYDFDVIQREFDISKEGNNLVYYFNDRGIKYKYYQLYNTLHITLSPSKLMGEQLTDITYYIFEEVYNNRLYELFNYIYPLEMQRLNRIDYKIDYYTEHKDKYLKLLKKTTKEYRHLKRKKEYNSSVYLVSKSRNINIYDKEQYCIDKGKTIEQIEKYKNCIRYEVQVKKDKIYYYKREWGLIDCLWNYCNLYDMRYFIDDILSPVIYQGDYYNLYHSQKILGQHYSLYMTNQLLEFQKLISSQGITDAKKEYSPYKFNKYIKQLQVVGINPIPIPKNEGITYLHNPIHIAA